jgi:hypothetical protein
MILTTAMLPPNRIDDVDKPLKHVDEMEGQRHGRPNRAKGRAGQILPTWPGTERSSQTHFSASFETFWPQGVLGHFGSLIHAVTMVDRGADASL